MDLSGQVIFIYVEKLSLFCLKRYVLIVLVCFFEINLPICRNGARRDSADLSILTDTKETWIHKHASPL